MNGESVDALRRMILGKLEVQYTDHQKQYVSHPRVAQKFGLVNRFCFDVKGQENTLPSTVRWSVWVPMARNLPLHVSAL